MVGYLLKMGICMARHKYLESERILDSIVVRNKKLMIHIVGSLIIAIKIENIRLLVLIHIQITQCFVFNL